MRFIYVLVSVFFAFLLYALYEKYMIDNIESIQFLFYGITACIITIKLINPVKYRFWDTFSHEFSHMIFAVLTLAKPSKFMVSPDNPEDGANGYIYYTFNDPSRFTKTLRNYFPDFIH